MVREAAKISIARPHQTVLMTSLTVSENAYGNYRTQHLHPSLQKDCSRSLCRSACQLTQAHMAEDPPEILSEHIPENL